ncbi:glutamine cyclotransferase [Terrimonas sp.]|uniref:glutaminyl-peptide cyclotransferase n=1 Tax=Terrimonas sp. TaxID=1914338 RepID=UPI000D51BB10|nr:glutaminyl-peptide cyclotransferase [Terrimonas sp.]PVD50605.1 glutamine cyclotransferase [Terrimonas sp.]
MVRNLTGILFMVILASACNNNADKKPEIQTTEPSNNIPAPSAVSYTVVNIYPHDTAAFTQGLIYYNNNLYEGTGQKKESTLRLVDLTTGRVENKVDINPEWFGEGITILNDTIYQLTWQDHVVLVYTLKDMKLVKQFKWTNEGWGITHDNTNLIISDGTDKLYYVRPSDFKLMKVISVSNNLGPVNNLNELEYIDGFIYANQWETDYILKIDPSSGFVKGVLDFSNALKKLANINYEKEAVEEGAVLNGIAWDAAGGRMFVTGKRWPKLLEIKMH